MRARKAFAIRQSGFTLMEAIIAITITGVIAGMVAVFIKSPVDAYVDTARRAALADVADTAVRRMGRDIRLALPNSVRNAADGSDQCVEFMPTKIGGRYRAAQTAGGLGDALDFTTTDDAFDMLWDNGSLPAADQIAANDVVVVYNDGYAGNAYSGTDAIKVASVAAGAVANTSKITFVGTGTGTPFNRKQFPAESPSYRFQVIPAAEQVVSYSCSGGTLYRNSRTLAAAWAQPANCAAMVSGATQHALAENVSSCSIRYQPPGSGTGAGRFGIVSITLAITQQGEAVGLYHQVHVDNAP